MARGDVNRVKIHYPGQDEDFIVFLDSVEDYQKWRSDKSVPLAHVVASFKIFITQNRGAQGMLEGASHSQLENEFGTSNEDEVVKQILEKGNLQEFEMSERHGNTNDSNGPLNNVSFVGR